MDLKTLTFVVVGLSFALYIGIAIWARAGTTRSSTSPVAAFTRSSTAWRPALTGCPPPPSSPWPV